MKPGKLYELFTNNTLDDDTDFIAIVLFLKEDYKECYYDNYVVLMPDGTIESVSQQYHQLREIIF